MATVVTVMNMKGGVGKTTVCAHLAGMLARSKRLCRRVLAIDYDPQFNLSQMYIRRPTFFALEKEGRTSLAILKDDETKVNPFVIEAPSKPTRPPPPEELAHNVYRLKHGGKLDIVPSTLDLMYIALGQPKKRTDAFEKRFASFIDACRDQYDVILIDCHPAGSILTRTALASSDHVLIPVLPAVLAPRHRADAEVHRQHGAEDSLPHPLQSPWASLVEARRNGDPERSQICQALLAAVAP